MKSGCSFVLLAFGLVLLILSITSYYKGFHNVDLVFNMKNLLEEQGENIDNYVDRYNSKGDVIDLIDLYAIGTEQMERGFYCSMVGAFLLGLSLLNIKFKDE